MQNLELQPLIPKRKSRFNIHDYQFLPEDKRYEIIDGDLFMVPAPLTHHQFILRNLLNLLCDYTKKNKLGEVLCAPVDIVFSKEDIVQPDIIFISNRRMGILKKENVQGAPDLVVEILSPSSVERDQEIKYKLYERHGVQEYWIADPDAKSIQVFQLTDDGFKLHRTFIESTHLQSPIFPDLKFLVADVIK